MLAAALCMALAGPSMGGLTGCKTSCSVDEEQVPTIVDDGITDAASGFYESTPWNGTWREFPPKRRYEFRHGLGGTPRDVKTYVSFSARPLPDEQFGNAAESAGNIVIFEEITSDYIRVRNDTCETFYLRVIASEPALEGQPPNGSGESGAGGSG